MFLIDRQYIRYFDWISFFLCISISLIGLSFVFSATYKPDLPYSIFFKKQAFGIISGLIIYLFFCIQDYRTLSRISYFFYFPVIALLIFTLIKGSIGMGAQRWINVGLFKFQPSELAKLLLPVFMSFYLLTQKNFPTLQFKNFLPMLVMVGISFCLVLKQPDLGTALILLFASLILLWMGGMPKKFYLISIIILLITAPLSWQFLKPYQQQRIAVFFGQGQMHKERYQIEQSKIAIGSGGLKGKGFLQGTQNKLSFLPESRTDFIFSVLAEEYGFVGVSLLLILFITLFIRLLYVITTFKNTGAQLIALAVVLHIIISTFVNIAMVIGLLPIVGIPLPLMSYGISHLWISFASLGWFNSIAMRRYYMTPTL